MGLSAWEVTRGTQTIGDFVFINAMLMQLSVPLNFIGFIYREIRQGITDIENMFELLNVPPEVRDRPGAKPLEVRRRNFITSASRTCNFPTIRTGASSKGISFEVPAPARRWPSSDHPERASRPFLATLVPLLRAAIGFDLPSTDRNIADVTTEIACAR